MIEIGKRARIAARVLACVDENKKNYALEIIADEIINNTDAILAANSIDLKNGEESGMSQALMDRLRLTEDRIKDIAASVRELIKLPDPIGRVIEEIERPNGLKLVKVSVPIGVVGIIYEARPNVTADSAALCLKSGNVVILRGGSNAINSNIAMSEVIRTALKKAGLPEDCVQLIRDTSRKSSVDLMRMNGYVDVIIPRGGAGLIQTVVKNATVPVIETGAGTCHVYVDKDADINMAIDIIYNAKTSRPSVCNAAECLLVHKDIAAEALPKIAKKLEEKNVELRADDIALKYIDAIPAKDDDWGKEYNDYILAVKVVDDIDSAIEHIFTYGTGHSECIITSNIETAEKFLNSVDAAAVYLNASTRFTDGGEFGMGAEIGISTQKLHARGPLGLRELTSMKYKIYGDGQVR